MSNRKTLRAQRAPKPKHPRETPATPRSRRSAPTRRMDTPRRPTRATDGAGQAREPTCRRVTIPPAELREAASERSERAGRACWR